jgi:hypothetical protein
MSSCCSEHRFVPPVRIRILDNRLWGQPTTEGTTRQRWCSRLHRRSRSLRPLLIARAAPLPARRPSAARPTPPERCPYSSPTLLRRSAAHPTPPERRPRCSALHRLSAARAAPPERRPSCSAWAPPVLLRPSAAPLNYYPCANSSGDVLAGWWRLLFLCQGYRQEAKSSVQVIFLKDFAPDQA